MEYFETSIENIFIYIKYLETYLKSNINQSRELEKILKPLDLTKKILKFYDCNVDIGKESVLNELYGILRKINFSMSDYLNGSYFISDKNFKFLIDTCYRCELFLTEILLEVKNNKVIDNNIRSGVYVLNIKNFINISKSPENIFFNLYQFKDQVYCFKTNDIFEYFYFFRSEKGYWYWSPPKKTDPEDIWITCPEEKIEKGYWIYKKIPEFVKNFIIWLDIFKPSIPEFYKL